MTRICSARSIRARSYKRVLTVILALLTAAALLSAPAGKKQPARKRPAAKNAVKKAAPKKAAAKKAVPKKPATNPDAVRFGHVIGEFQDGNFQAALDGLTAVKRRLPQLADYIAFHTAAARKELKDYAGARQDLASFWDAPTPSPLLPRAVLLEASALMELSMPLEAARLLRAHYADLPQPVADMALGAAYRAADDPAQAAVCYQRVYYLHPTAKAVAPGALEPAAEAGTAVEEIRAAMGDDYPPAMPEQMMQRADEFLAAQDYKRARSEYLNLIPRLGGAQRDLASVRVGATDFLGGQTPAAYRYLKNVKVEDADADAERLYYLAECLRRLSYARESEMTEMLETVKNLGKLYPRSPWHRRALISAANRYLVLNESESFVPLFHACSELFRGDEEAELCEWRVTWHAYLGRRSDAGDRLKEYLSHYPDSARASAALYYLGRLAEGAKRLSDAHEYYAAITSRYPNYYYGLLARERLATSRLVAAPPSERVNRFLSDLKLRPPAQAEPGDHEATPATKRRIERARLLSAAGQPDWAAAELRFGARTDGQATMLAVALAGFADTPHESLRAMKSMSSDYFSMPLESAPRDFWTNLFPMPFRNFLLRSANERALDPYIVAGLIRQESEFNPRAVSPAKAYGLTQIRPPTGREVARRVGVRAFSTRMLFRPETNLKLGSYYLRSMLDRCNGKWEEALAAYNAGKSRVDRWNTWGDFQEPSEFVESIPFTETREYVQAVLRNAAVYKLLYGNQESAGSAPRGIGKAASN